MKLSWQGGQLGMSSLAGAFFSHIRKKKNTEQEGEKKEKETKRKKEVKKNG